MKKSLFFSALMLGALVLAGCQGGAGTPETDSTKLWKAQKDGGTSWGFINASGDMSISAKYDDVHPFSCGLALVQEGSDYKYIDKSGNKVGKTPESNARNDFYYDLCVINPEGEYCFIDKKLAKVGKKYDDLASMTADGLARFGKKEDNGTMNYGYCDRNGEIKIKASFLERTSQFIDGYAVVVKRNDNNETQYGVIDKNEKVIIDYQKKELENLGQGLFSYFDNNAYGIWDKNMKDVGGDTYAYIGKFTDGLAKVQNKSGKYGYINASGTVKIDLEYFDAKEFYEGVAWVKENSNSKWKLIDKSGKEKFELESKNQEPVGVFRQGLCWVQNGNSNAYYNTNGKAVYEWKSGGSNSNHPDNGDNGWNDDPWGGAPARKAANPMAGTEYAPSFE